MKICDIFNPQVRSRITDKRNITKNAEFSSPPLIYSKDIVIEAELKFGRKHKFSDSDEASYFYGSEKAEPEKSERKTGKDDLKNLLNRSKFNETKQNNFLSSPCFTNTNELSINNNEKKSDRKYSDVSFSSERTFNTDNPKEKKRSIFSRRFRSRFDFCLNDEREKEEGIYIPEYLSGIISFKTSTYFYLKNIEFNEDISKNKINPEDWDRIAFLNLKEKIL
jgi:hypothetical protein